VGGDPLPGVGFAMGDMVITLLLEKYNHLPSDLNKPPASVLVTVFDESTLLASFLLAAELRQSGLKVNCYPETAKLGKQFKFADRAGIKIAIVMGPDELKNNQVTIKNLGTGAQRTVSRVQAASVLQEMLEKPSPP
jgi:histidyl-tRNA synthetase